MSRIKDFSDSLRMAADSVDHNADELIRCQSKVDKIECSAENNFIFGFLIGSFVRAGLSKESIIEIATGPTHSRKTISELSKISSDSIETFDFVVGIMNRKATMQQIVEVIENIYNVVVSNIA